jgi:hypothetical protein
VSTARSLIAEFGTRIVRINNGTCCAARPHEAHLAGWCQRTCIQVIPIRIYCALRALRKRVGCQGDRHQRCGNECFVVHHRHSLHFGCCPAKPCGNRPEWDRAERSADFRRTFRRALCFAASPIELVCVGIRATAGRDRARRCFKTGYKIFDRYGEQGLAAETPPRWPCWPAKSYGIWLTSFMHYDLGYFDLEQKTCNPRQPVRHEVVTHVLGTICHLCVRAGQYRSGAPRPMKMGTTVSPWRDDGIRGSTKERDVPCCWSRDNDALLLKQANFRNRATASASFAMTVKQHGFTSRRHGGSAASAS